MEWQFYWRRPFRLYYNKNKITGLGLSHDYQYFIHTLIIGPFQCRWYS